RSPFGKGRLWRNAPRLVSCARRSRFGARSCRHRDEALSASPFFIVSSGRSGTAMLAKALGLERNLRIEHEYMVHMVQPLAVRRHFGLASAQDACVLLRSTHGAAAHYATTSLWGDSSNKLSWLIADLAAVFPEARFVHLVRDGRKVASSYFHKLADECYDDRS